MLKNTDQSYGLMSKTLHWVTALIILGLLSLGFYLGQMEFSPLKLQLFGLHKSFGMLVLLLVALRVAWRGISVFPKSLPTHAVWEKALAKGAHILLYAAMIGMPMTGWLMSSAGEFPNIFFGLFEVPALTGKDEALFKLMRQLHGTFALILIGIIALHAAGAFKHHFIDKDSTLRRMTANGLGFVGGSVLVLAAAVLLGAPVMFYIFGSMSKQASEAQESAAVQETVQGGEWVINPQDSFIEFEVTQYGQPFNGRFENFTGEIVFDPNDLDNARAEIVIDIASLQTGSEDRDNQARSGEWFDVERHPQAIFKTTEFKIRKPNHSNPNHYEARGNLTLRGVTLPLILPFSLVIEDNDEGGQHAIMDAELFLNRLDYGVGQGQWESTEAIGGQVFLKVSVSADKTRP